MENNIKQLHQKLEKTSGQERLDILLALAEQYSMSDIRKCVEFATLAQQLAFKLGIDSIISRCFTLLITNYKRLGENETLEQTIENALVFIEKAEPIIQARTLISIGVHFSMGRLSEDALIHFNRALTIAENLNDPKLMTILLLNMGIAYNDLFLTEKATLVFYKALEIVEREEFHTYKIDLLINLSNVFGNLKQMDKKEEYLKEAMAIAEVYGDIRQKAICSGNLGVNAYFRSEFKEALKYFEINYNYIKSTGDIQGQMLPLNNIGRALLMLGDYKQSLESFAKSLDIAIQINQKPYIAILKMNIGYCMIKLGEYLDGIELIHEAERIADDDNTVKERIDIMMQLSNVYAEAGDYKNAYTYGKKWQELESVYQSEQHSKYLTEIETRHKTESKRREAELLRIKNDELQVEIIERKKIEAELREALSNIKVLRGLIPICSHCKKIRDDKGFWNQFEAYISKHSEMVFSHGICPDCITTHYPNIKEKSGVLE